MGVTFTLSSNGAMDHVADLVLPPFKPWDAMICISQAGFAAVAASRREHPYYDLWALGTVAAMGELRVLAGSHFPG